MWISDIWEEWLNLTRSGNFDVYEFELNRNGKYTAKSARQLINMGANVILSKSTVADTASGSYTAASAVKGLGGAVRYVDLVNGRASITLASGVEAILVVMNTQALV